mgnify:CR=1 FL=1
MFEYVKINDKKFPIKFGFNALRHFSKATGTSIADMSAIGENMDFDTAIQLMFYGLQDGARASKESFNYTLEALGDDLDHDIDAIERCMTIFATMMGGKEEEKKSPVKAKGKKKK